MKLAIVGSRTFEDYDLMCRTLACVRTPIDAIISGGARGADALAARYARANGIELVEILAEWDRYGKSAGYRRNTDIIAAADCVLAFHDGVSRGTAHSISLARKTGKLCHVIYFTPGQENRPNTHH